LSGRGPCDELITRPEESYRLWCVVVCDLEISWRRRPWPTGGGGGAGGPITNKINVENRRVHALTALPPANQKLAVTIWCEAGWFWTCMPKRSLWPVSNPGCRALTSHCSDLAIPSSIEGQAH
jgi:hypothetical protein